MKNRWKITAKDVENIILGSTFYGTGGGGSPDEADLIYKSAFEISPEIELIGIAEFEARSYFVSAFGIGSAGIQGSPELSLRNSLEYLNKIIKHQITAIVPVEIGPKALAMAFYLAALLKLPILDADIVGGRSTPEVFLETITLYNIPRTPAVLSNVQGDLVALLESSSAQQEEKLMRDFSRASGGQAFVLGYSLSHQQASEALEQETVSKALSLGQNYKSLSQESFQNIGAKLFFKGYITEIINKEDLGFLTLNLKIKNPQQTAEVFIKNENLILWIDQKPVLTCPDLIIILQAKSLLAIYNTNLTIGEEVIILGLPAQAKWRSSPGQELFNPRTFGFDVDVKLI
jgi:DUF917 family protein